ncbi:hypothetical protein CEXT_681661 [Caerostris extrusa]|uniref:Uncharacterized protein n=1 Tax=Caerostris extrusa TaxID=172846 RepID=A0AAV4MA67_CAEEX|nr:hypothetical protein CEXT_681661 [Caerostris extrusa]
MQIMKKRIRNKSCISSGSEDSFIKKKRRKKLGKRKATNSFLLHPSTNTRIRNSVQKETGIPQTATSRSEIKVAEPTFFPEHGGKLATFQNPSPENVVFAPSPPQPPQIDLTLRFWNRSALSSLRKCTC